MQTEKVNDGCVGPSSESAGKADACAGCPNQSACASGAGKGKEDPALDLIGDKLSRVKHKILVLSGKGGVGKSTFSAQLAFSLARQGLQIGLLDVDICGPSIPRMLGLIGQEVHQSASGWSPVYVDDNLGVMSIGFMLPSSDDAIIWRGPRKNGLIKQFLSDVDWGELDYLIVDTPPGTSDEHISIVQYLKASGGVDGAVIVTTPQEVSMDDVKKEISFCKKTGVPVLGVVENMADITIPFSSFGVANMTSPSGSYGSIANSFLVNDLGDDVTDAMIRRIKEVLPELMTLSVRAPLFTPITAGRSNPQTMAIKFGVPYLGRLPMDPNMMKACEEGLSLLEHFPLSPAAVPFEAITKRIISTVSIPLVSTSSTPDSSTIDNAAIER